MANSTQPNRIIICDASAFRALRCERRRYQSLGWTPLSSREIQLAVSCSSANANCIDYDLLEQLGVWSPGEKLHLLVDSSAKRRYTSPVYPHAITKPLPARSLYNIAPGIDILSPMMIATQYASRHSFGQTYAFFEELCSEITLAEPGYEEWLPGGTENEVPATEDGTSNETVSIPKISCFKSEPVLSPSELTNWLEKVNQFPGLKQARTVAPYVLGNARSPMEIMMFGCSACQCYEEALPARAAYQTIASSLKKRQSRYLVCHMRLETSCFRLAGKFLNIKAILTIQRNHGSETKSEKPD